MFAEPKKQFKHAIVIGNSKMVVELATTLSKINEYVTLIDADNAFLKNLPSAYLGNTIEGDPLEFSVLESADAKRCDILFVLSSDDAKNIFIAHMAKTHFDIERVVIHLEDDGLSKTLDNTGIDYVSPTGIEKQSFLQFVESEGESDENNH